MTKQQSSQKKKKRSTQRRIISVRYLIAWIKTDLRHSGARHEGHHEVSRGEPSSVPRFRRLVRAKTQQPKPTHRNESLKSRMSLHFGLSRPNTTPRASPALPASRDHFVRAKTRALDPVRSSPARSNDEAPLKEFEGKNDHTEGQKSWAQASSIEAKLISGKSRLERKLENRDRRTDEENVAEKCQDTMRISLRQQTSRIAVYAGDRYLFSLWSKAITKTNSAHNQPKRSPKNGVYFRSLPSQGCGLQ